jgi:hypothetical protein
MTKETSVVFAEMENHKDMARVVNALETVKEFKESGDEVELIFDGGGVTSAVTLADPDNQLHRLYSQVEDKAGGICRYCSRAFEVYDQAEKIGIPFATRLRKPGSEWLRGDYPLGKSHKGE